MRLSNTTPTRHSSRLGCFVLLAAVGVLSSCTDSIAGIVEARRLAAELHVQFSKAADASSRAVMADTDETSAAFAKEAGEAKQAAEQIAAALAPHLQELHLDEETRLLNDFVRNFAAYKTFDRSLLELAVQNTNLKAQKLAFGPVRAAADAFSKALDAVVLSTPPKNRCQVESAAQRAVLAVREIQVLDAPHIAEPAEDSMLELERAMSEHEAAAQIALTALAGLLEPAARAPLTDAQLAFERFKKDHTQILVLSRRNSNVRSLAMVLGEARVLIAACEGSLRSLEGVLAKQKFKATR